MKRIQEAWTCLALSVVLVITAWIWLGAASAGEAAQLALPTPTWVLPTEGYPSTSAYPVGTPGPPPRVPEPTTTPAELLPVTAAPIQATPTSLPSGYPALPPYIPEYPITVWPLDNPPGMQTVIVGPYPGSGFGEDFAIGDVNGDHVEDLILGAPYASAQAFAGGEVFVYLGPLVFGQTITVPDRAALILEGIEGDQPQLGKYLASGDLNGDGYDDIVMSGSVTTRTYVYLGSSAITTDSPVTVVIKSDTAALTVLGTDSRAITCNLNGDAYDDLLAQHLVTQSVPPYLSVQVWGILGSPALSVTRPVVIDPQKELVDIRIDGIHPDEWYGEASNLGCGDVDGDGYADLVIGAYAESPAGRKMAGRVYIVRGSPDFQPDHRVTIQLPDQADAIINGTIGDVMYSGEMVGKSLAVADVSGDARADLILVAPRGNKVYLWLGHELNGQTVDLESQAEWELVRLEPTTVLGQAIGTGDVDGDGRAEIILGCLGCNKRTLPPYVHVFGAGYVVDGDRIRDKGVQPLAKVASLEFVPALDISNNVGAAAGAGDLDGDGYEDVILSSAETFYDTPGAVFVISYPFHPAKQIATSRTGVAGRFGMVGLLLFVILASLLIIIMLILRKPPLLKAAAEDDKREKAGH